MGGYSPKIHDGQWLQVNKDQFGEIFKGGVVAGDCHYKWGVEGFKYIKFRVPFEEPKGKRKRGGADGEGLAQLTKDQNSYNKAIRRVRGRVESPFCENQMGGSILMTLSNKTV